MYNKHLMVDPIRTNTSNDSHKEIVNNISKDLKCVDYDYVHSLLDIHSWESTSKILGYDVREYDHLILAGRMIIYSLKSKLGSSLSDYVGRMNGRLKPSMREYIRNNEKILQNMYDEIDRDDNKYDWFSANSIIKTYLSKNGKGGDPIETPNQMRLRIAIALYKNKGLNEIRTCLNDMANEYYIPASPTIFNAGMSTGQMSSCFLLSVEDSLDSIEESHTDIAFISKSNGATGFDVSRIRHSKIGLDGDSDGLVPWLYYYNALIRAVNQNGRRKGAATAYCRPHHIDIYEFCEMSLKTGDHYSRAHDMNFAVWFPRLFWQRIRTNSDWTMFCPNETKTLNDIWGDEWEQEYIKYENNTELNIKRKVVKAQHLLIHMINCQRKSSMPYILHCDAVNMKSNQNNLGYIRNSNLCLEICEYSAPDEIASCNLSSISLRSFVKKPFSLPAPAPTLANEGNTVDNINIGLEKDMCEGLVDSYDFDHLGVISRRVTQNLNKVIEENTYTNIKIKNSNERHRPIGIGVSGFGDMLAGLDLPFESSSAVIARVRLHPVTKQLNKMIFACMYWNSMAESVELAIELGKYETFDGSPLSKGKFQFDLWADETKYLKSKGRLNETCRTVEDDTPIDPQSWSQKPISLSNGDIILPSWDDLRRCVQKYGVRNSLLIALMPTASSSQPLRNSETVEAHQSNIYSRKLLSGAYPVVNRYLVSDLKHLNVWNKYTVNLMQADNGSISKLGKYVSANPDKYPEFVGSDAHYERLNWLMNKYRTMWELKMKTFLFLASDRGRYVCQSQSTNLYLEDPSDDQLCAIHQLTDALGLKTGMYYLREGAAVSPIKFTVDPEIISFVNFVEADEHIIEMGNNKTVDNEAKMSNISGKEYQVNGKTYICEDDVCIACQ